MSDSPDNSPDTVQTSGSTGKILLVIAGLAVLIFLAHSWRSRQPVFDISVNGNEMLSPDEVLKNINSSVRNQPVESVQLASVKEEIEKNSLVKEAIVRRRGVRGIEVLVQERQPIAAIVYPEGDLQFIDGDGVKLPYDRFLKKSDVPLLRGLVLKGRIDTLAMRSSIEIVKQVSSQIKNGPGAVSEVEYTRSDSTFLLVGSEGIQIMLGNKKIDAVLKKLALLQQGGFAKSMMSGVEYVDLRWKGKVITRKRKVNI